MSQISIDNVLKVNQDISRYRFELKGFSSLFYKGEIERQSLRQHILLSTDKDDIQAEIFWEEKQSIGRRLDSDNWFKLNDKPLPDYLEFSLKLLKEVEPTKVYEEGEFQVLEYVPEDLPILKAPAEFFKKTFGEPADKKSQKFFDKFLEKAGLLKSYSMALYISKESNLITRISSNSVIEDKQITMDLNLEPLEEDLPSLPEAVQLINREKISKEGILFKMPTLGGWNWGAHGPWAQYSIDLIQQNDENKKEYEEIYSTEFSVEKYTEEMAINKIDVDCNKHHPIILGTNFEDYSDIFPDFYQKWFNYDPKFLVNPSLKPGGYKRYYHHFGGRDIGLEHAWYFIFHGYPPTTVGDRYYSARNWGYGGNRIDENLNHMTFTEAIRQYDRYSFEGKRNAYLILGHVVHLLQDVGDPDHARNVAHPGSGYNEKEAYNMYGYCHFLAGEAAGTACAACVLWCPICSVAAFGIAEAACYGSIDENEMGYEKFIETKWTLNRLLGENGKFKGTILKDHGFIYDDFFHNMSDFAINKANEMHLESPLGCGWLKLVPPVPGADPDIQSDNENESKPYMILTDELATKVIGYSAGMIQYFYEIVNYPPFVERIVIVNSEKELKPQGFAKLPDDKVVTCYDSEWKQTGPFIREKTISIDNSLNPNKNAYVFIQFGPNLPPLKSKKVKDLKMKLTGNGISDIDIPLNESTDSQVGVYYWGSFQPLKRMREYVSQIEIDARDTSAHLMKRPERERGYELDSNPTTIAAANAENPNLYSFNGYEPGVDKNHSIKIESSKSLPLPLILAALD